jgi:MraZ protein
VDGEYSHNLDAKKRLTIPSKYRDELGADVVLVRGSAKNLLLFPYDLWKERLKGIDEFPPAQRNALRELAYHYASRTSPDAQGRIIIPKDHLDHADIDTSVVVIGQGDYSVIWSAEKWEAHIAELEAGLLDGYAALQF